MFDFSRELNMGLFTGHRLYVRNLVKSLRGRIIMIKHEKILEIEVSNLNYKQLRKQIINDIGNNKKSSIIAINPEKIMNSKKNEELKFILNNATYKIADGIGVIIASKIKKGNLTTRITGIDAMEMLCQLANDKLYKVFLYGAQKNVILETKNLLSKKYPNINIVGIIDGFEKDNDMIIKTINKVKPHILFVALGSPKQEFWISEHIDKLDVNVFQGVGGSFDVISGNIRRAPRFIRKIGLEWMYRLIKEPKRIWRQLKLLKFLLIILVKKD